MYHAFQASNHPGDPIPLQFVKSFLGCGDEECEMECCSLGMAIQVEGEKKFLQPTSSTPANAIHEATPLS